MHMSRSEREMKGLKDTEGKKEERNPLDYTVHIKKESLLSIYCFQSFVMQITSAIPQGKIVMKDTYTHIYTP